MSTKTSAVVSAESAYRGPASRRSSDPKCPCQDGRTLNRQLFFTIGDFAFLAIVGTQAALVMHAMHNLNMAFVWVSVLGMACAMAIQMLMAFAVSPLLGSIESMTPSMLVAMAVPMLMDAIELAGRPLGMHEAALLGFVLGLAYAAYLLFYGSRCRRRLSALAHQGALQP